MSEQVDIILSEAVDTSVIEQDFLNMSDEELANVNLDQPSIPEVLKENNDSTEVEVSDKEQIDTPNKDITIDYKAAYEKILSPFKASGKERRVDTIDDAIKLMQKGADYALNMTQLKPLKILNKTLEKNGITQDDLNFLIDLKSKNPEAVKKVLQDSGIDPLDIDLQNDTKYTPKDYSIDASQIELDEVIASIKTTPQFENTSKILSSWDTDSGNYLVKNPNTISIINEQIGNGIFDQINNVVEQQRMLGNLNDISDFDAYCKVGTYLQENNLFKEQKTIPETIQQSVQNTTNTDTTKQKKIAASVTKATTKTTPIDVQSIDWLSLNDDEFAAMEKQLKLR